MAIMQTIWSLDDGQVLPLDALINEKELEDLLCEHIELLNPDWLVIGRQVRTSANKLIDLLCMDRDGDIVIVELKKGMTPREVTAQAIDYASCVDKLHPEDFAEIYLQYSKNNKSLGEAYREKFRDDLDEDTIKQKVKMVIVATQMDDSTERIIAYLQSKYQVNINILFFNVFQHNGQRLLSRAWFQEDAEVEKIPSAQVSVNWNHEYYCSFGAGGRTWADAKKYGFISAGGGAWYTNTLKMLSVGDRVWVNIPHAGYVGVGIVTSEAQMAKEAFIAVGTQKCPFSELALTGEYGLDKNDPETAEYIVCVDWQYTTNESNAVKETGFFGNQNTICRPTSSKWEFTVGRLKQLWNIA
ncbi:MAG: endonuclease NucS domain-containing protein [bacterium]